MTQASGTILAGGCQPEGRGAGMGPRKNISVVLVLVGLWMVAAALQPVDAATSGRSHLLSDPVHTADGLVSGVPGKLDGVVAFKGIPFGAPPTGELRWRPPQPVVAWSGVRPGDKFGPACIQPHQPQREPNNRAVDLPDSPPVSEDCLYLNVWTPAGSPSARLPVMVWIYGGAYTEGAGSSPYNQGDTLAVKGVVVVTFNYRLGALGFLAHPELTAESPHHASGNYALTDVLTALQWVQKNIADFGGDPRNVTIFGESAGAAISAALVGTPIAKGLFQRAICESGLWMGLNLAPMRPLESAEQQTVKVATELGAPLLADLRKLSADDAANKLPKQGMIIDGWVVPEDLTRTFAEGRQNAVDILAGSNRDEGSFAGGFGPPMTVGRWKSGAGLRWGGAAALGLEAYPAVDDPQAAANNTRIFADNMAWITRFYAARQRALGRHAYVYLFVHEPPYAQGARNLGVCHTCELPYVFDNLGTLRLYPDSSSPERALASPADVKLAAMTSAYWINFARTGDPNGKGLPNWPLFKDLIAGPVMHLGPQPAVAESLSPTKLKLYQALYDQQFGQH
jgi:para-nitrobenzyl esterase